MNARQKQRRLEREILRFVQDSPGEAMFIGAGLFIFSVAAARSLENWRKQNGDG